MECHVVSEEAYRPLAEVAVRVGVNLQKGQDLVVTSDTQHASAVQAVAKAAYDAGAHRVWTFFSDEALDRITFERAADEALQDFPAWRVEMFMGPARAKAAFLTVLGNNPDAFANVPPKRLAMVQKAGGQAMKPFRDLTMNHRIAWSVTSAPSPEWAKRVFPDLPAEAAEARLWQAILEASRADGADPVGAWQRHKEELSSRREWLDSLAIDSLHYVAPGTDLTVRLPGTHTWVAAGKLRGLPYVTCPNVPTEECFTAPQRDGVDGTVRSTRPLSLGGQLVEGIELTFENGRVVKASAAQGEAALTQLIGTDEGAHYLGEVALVPVDSPIARSRLLFYNTLFDENASCHLALGQAYPICLTDGHDAASEEDLMKKGANVSLAHVDFMVGSEDLDITATTRDGRNIGIFRKGLWASPVA